MEPAVLDLDVPPGGDVARDGLRQRRFGPVSVAAAVLVGMVAATVGTHLVEDRQRRAAERAEVSLTVLVASAGTGGGDGRRMTIEGSLAVANSGPVPVLVEEVEGSTGGLRFWSTSARTIRPGVDLVPVTVTVDCAAPIPAEPLAAQLNVRTADGEARVVSSLMTVLGTPWETRYICPGFFS